MSIKFFIIIPMQYKDIQRDEMMLPRKRFNCKYARALDLQAMGFVRIL